MDAVKLVVQHEAAVSRGALALNGGRMVRVTVSCCRCLSAHHTSSHRAADRHNGATPNSETTVQNSKTNTVIFGPYLSLRMMSAVNFLVITYPTNSASCSSSFVSASIVYAGWKAGRGK